MASHSRGSVSRAGPASGWSTRSATRSGRGVGCRTAWPSPSSDRRCWRSTRRSGLRDRELHLAGVALGAASPTETPETGAVAAIGALRGFLAELGLRPSLSSLGFDDAGLDVVAQDAVDDAAIRNSPRLPSLEEARAMPASVA